MEEPIWHTVWQILTYQGSNIDIVINYVMCCVALYACLTVDRPPSPIQESRRRPRCTYSAFIIFETVALLLYQVILCIGNLLWHSSRGTRLISFEGVHCTGVSIVWSALFGTYCFFDRHRFPALKSLTYVFVTSAVWAYYFATEDGLTTVAHFSAFILGSLRK